MSVDMDKMRKRYDEQQSSGGDFYSFENGETLVYVHPPCREDDEWEPTDGVPYVPVVVHYSVGKGDSMVVSLDTDRNPILSHPFIKRILKKKKVKLTGECPVAKELASGNWSDDEADDSRPQTKYLWGITPLKHRSKSSAPWAPLSAKPTVCFVGKQIYDGIMEAFFDNGDISDPDQAVLVKVVKKGVKRNTKYEVKVEPSTLKKAFKLPAKMRSALAKFMAEGGDGDLFRIVGNMVKSPTEVQAIIEGVKVDDEPDDDEEDDEELVDEESDDEDELEDEEAEEPEDDSEESDEDEEAEESDEEESDEEPEEDEDEEDEEDEEPPPPKKKASKKTSKKAASKSKSNGSKAKPADDDDDLGLDDLEAELEALEGEEEEKPKTSKKAKKKASKKRSSAHA